MDQPAPLLPFPTKRKRRYESRRAEPEDIVGNVVRFVRPPEWMLVPADIADVIRASQQRARKGQA